MRSARREWPCRPHRRWGSPPRSPATPLSISGAFGLPTEPIASSPWAGRPPWSQPSRPPPIQPPWSWSRLSRPSPVRPPWSWSRLSRPSPIRLPSLSHQLDRRCLSLCRRRRRSTAWTAAGEIRGHWTGKNGDGSAALNPSDSPTPPVNLDDVPLFGPILKEAVRGVQGEPLDDPFVVLAKAARRSHAPAGGVTAPRSLAPDPDKAKALGANALAAVFGFQLRGPVSRRRPTPAAKTGFARGGTPSEAACSRGRGGFGPRPLAFRQGRRSRRSRPVRRLQEAAERAAPDPPPARRDVAARR